MVSWFYSSKELEKKDDDEREAEVDENKWNDADPAKVEDGSHMIIP